MFLLYHHSLCPFSRKARILLREKNIEFESVIEEYWKCRQGFIELSPEAQTPVIIDDKDNTVLSGINAIDEYLEEVFDDTNFIGESTQQRMKVRRVKEWFDVKFYHEVTKYIIREKVIKTIMRSGSPNSNAIRAAKKNFVNHLKYIEFLVRHSPYLCGDSPMIADFAAAAQISILDYLDDIEWNRYIAAKEWYSLIKSRPSFRLLLSDRVPYVIPAINYCNLDL